MQPLLMLLLLLLLLDLACGSGKYRRVVPSGESDPIAGVLWKGYANNAGCQSDAGTLRRLQDVATCMVSRATTGETIPDSRSFLSLSLHVLTRLVERREHRKFPVHSGRKGGSVDPVFPTPSGGASRPRVQRSWRATYTEVRLLWPFLLLLTPVAA